MIRKLLISASVLVLTLGANAKAAKPAPQGGSKEHPVAVIQTSMGDLRCELNPKYAPLGVANFIGLAKGTKDWTDPRTRLKKHGVPLYDNTIFHRVIPNFMIQGGDPARTGAGDIGFQFKNEVSPSLLFDHPGRLAYANAGPDTNGSQFFITEGPSPSLNGNYTIFGQCDGPSVELVKKIARKPRSSSDKPNSDIVIKHIVIDEGSGK